MTRTVFARFARQKRSMNKCKAWYVVSMHTTMVKMCNDTVSMDSMKFGVAVSASS